LEDLRAVTPPWVVGLLAQVAAVNALGDPDYYQARYAETHQLREELAAALKESGWLVVPGVANFLMARLPEFGVSADQFIRACRQRGLFLRDVSRMGSQVDPRSIRIAVKDRATNFRMLRIMHECFR
jgi:histidinol-phosphate/aromatic aminotransferase/cobyric acid decarboxylase-like protein